MRIDEILAFNERFVEQTHLPTIGHAPRKQMALVTCMDCRLVQADPADAQVDHVRALWQVRRYQRHIALRSRLIAAYANRVRCTHGDVSDRPVGQVRYRRRLRPRRFGLRC